jgi:hypothetical protein
MLEAIPTADKLIKEHGELAPNIAGKHARELRKSGDAVSSQQWMKVLIDTKYLLARDYAE